MVLISLECPFCGSGDVRQNRTNNSRPGVRSAIVKQSVNGSGIRVTENRQLG